MSRGKERALTAREREIMTLIAKGMSNKEIARTLGITDGTVKVHVHHIYEKLGSRNRVRVVLFLLEKRQEEIEEQIAAE